MRRQRGFTLIELLVVIAIIAILATLVVNQLISARKAAANGVAKSDIAQAGKSVEVYKTVNSTVLASSANNAGSGTGSAGAIVGSGDTVGSNWKFNGSLYDMTITKVSGANVYVYKGVATTPSYVVGTSLVPLSGTAFTSFYVKDGVTTDGGGNVPTAS